MWFHPPFNSIYGEESKNVFFFKIRCQVLINLVFEEISNPIFPANQIADLEVTIVVQTVNNSLRISKHLEVIDVQAVCIKSWNQLYIFSNAREHRMLSVLKKQRSDLGEDPDEAKIKLQAFHHCSSTQNCHPVASEEYDSLSKIRTKAKKKKLTLEPENKVRQKRFKKSGTHELIFW